MVANLEKEKAKMSAEVAKLTKELAETEEEWEKMKDPSKLVKMKVKQSGSGAGGDLEPTFIECRSEGIKVYKGKDAAFEVKTAAISKDPKLQNLVKALAKEAPYRTWFSAQGTPMDARYLKREGPMIYLKDKNGRELKFSSLKLSKASQQIAAKYEIARKAKRPDPEARFIIFLSAARGFHRGRRPYRFAPSLTAGMDRFLSMGKGKSIFLSLRVHEEEKERRRSKLGFPS